jgi:O-methyltransferase involved in polyketide biosynthesis
MSQQTKGTEHSVSHVSDTALWVAVHRAAESKRKDALFRDPYAERLAGERGKHIAGQLDPGNGSAWSIITRTAVLDDLIMIVPADARTSLTNQ